MAAPVEFRSTATIQPGGISGRVFRRLLAPPSTELQLEARQQRIGLDPQTGRILGTVFTGAEPETMAKVRFQQDLLFAQLTGATACQLGVGISAGDPILAGLTATPFGGPVIGSAGCKDARFLRPDQIASLQALGSPPLGESFGNGGAFQPTGAAMSGADQVVGQAQAALAGIPLVPLLIGAAALFLFLRR